MRRNWHKISTLLLFWLLLAGAIIQSGASTDTWTIGATSKAGRVTLYDDRGNSMGQKITYRAATADTVAAASSATVPFFEACGSATKTVRIQWVRMTGPTTATLAIQGVTLKKNSTQTSGGTPVNLTMVPLDANSASATAAIMRVFTAVPTAGTLVGNVASVRMLNKSTTVVDGSEMADKVFDFRTGMESEAIVLRGTGQCLTGQLHVAAATTLSVHVEWTEE